MKAKPKSEAWVKKEVKKIFAEYGCPSPYMPAASIYGKAGGADFIECMFGYYVATAKEVYAWGSSSWWNVLACI